MKKYQILEHPADIKIRVFGSDKKALFAHALLAMFAAADYQEEKSRPAKAKIEVASPTLTSLLVDFLSEALYLSEVRGEVYQKIKFEKFTDRNLKGSLRGKKLKRMGVQIKGVTYHQLDIHRREDGLWQATIVFDV